MRLPQYRICRILTDLSVSWDDNLVLATAPNVMASAVADEGPAEFAQSLLKVASLHPSQFTRIGGNGQVPLGGIGIGSVPIDARFCLAQDSLVSASQTDLQQQRSGRSDLSRLFTYSKDNEVLALENFVTEALAIAICRSPATMIAALGLPDVLGRKIVSTDRIIAVNTQQFLDGGFLDLALTLCNVAGQTFSVWIESKIGAPLSEAQINGYLTSAHAAEYDVHVVVLSRTKLTTAAPCLLWSELLAVAWQIGEPDWSDLVKFLEENQVTDRSRLPIADFEAASLDGAHQLLTKVSAVTVEVHRKVVETWPQYKKILFWPAEGAFRSQTAQYLRGRPCFLNTAGPLYFGAELLDGSSYWVLGVGPSSTSKKTIENIAGLQLPSDWIRDASGSTKLTKRVRIGAQPTFQGAVDWFWTSLGEVAKSGVVDQLLIGAPQPSAQSIAPEASDV